MPNRHPDYLALLLGKRGASLRNTDILNPAPLVTPGQGIVQAPGDTSGPLVIETLPADPGAPVQGRFWGLGTTSAVLKYFDGLVKKFMVMVTAAPTQSGDAVVSGAGPSFAPAYTPQYADIQVILDAGGVLISTGQKMDMTLDFPCVVVGWTVMLDTAATVRIDLWKDTYANYPPTIADTMPGANANKPQTVAANKATGAVAGWSLTAFAAGDTLRVNLDLNDLATHITLTVKVRKT